MTTTVDCVFVTPEGDPIANATVEFALARSGYTTDLDGVIMPRLITAETDAGGLLTIELWATPRPYYVRCYDPLSEAEIFFRILVPDTDLTIRFQDIIIEGTISDSVWDTEAITTINEAKALALASKIAAEAAAASAAASAAAAGAAGVASAEVDIGGHLQITLLDASVLDAGYVVGPQGDQGDAGAAGKTILYGTAAPTTEGVDGDFYIRTTTNFIYGPKASGAWPAGTSLVGPTGDAGADGVDGADGGLEPQVAIPRQYFGADGILRPPVSVGSGALTVGTPAASVNNTKYNAWVTQCRLHNGNIFRLFTEADTHHADNTGKVMGQIGVETFNGYISSVTWGSTFVIYDDPSVWVSGIGVTQLKSGRVVVTFFGGNYSTDPLDGAFLTYSDNVNQLNAAATWSSPVTVNSTLTSYSYASSRVLELPSGTCLMMVEGKNSGDTFSRIVVLASTDDCATWGSQVTLVTGTRNYYEGCWQLLDDGSIYVLLRTTDGNGDIYWSESLDGGVTFSAPVLAFAGHGMPSFIQTSTGTLIALTRKNEGLNDGDTIAYTSLDRGRSWGSLITIDSTMIESMYGCPLELRDGRIHISYGYETSIGTNSDIYEVIVTETKRKYLDIDTGAAVQGDILYRSATGWTRLAVGTVGQVLRCMGAGANPVWASNLQCIPIACGDETTEITVGNNKVVFRMPYPFTLVAVKGSLTTSGTGSGNLTIDINEGLVSILSTKLTFDAAEESTESAATPAVISDASLGDNAEIEIDVDAVFGTYAGAGLKIYLIGYPT